MSSSDLTTRLRLTSMLDLRETSLPPDWSLYTVADDRVRLVRWYREWDSPIHSVFLVLLVPLCLMAVLGILIGATSSVLEPVTTGLWLACVLALIGTGIWATRNLETSYTLGPNYLEQRRSIGSYSRATVHRDCVILLEEADYHRSRRHYYLIVGTVSHRPRLRDSEHRDRDDAIRLAHCICRVTGWRFSTNGWPMP